MSSATFTKNYNTMTEETRKKANELATKIKDTELYLRDCNIMLENNYSDIVVRCPLSTTILSFEIPRDICHKVLEMSENALECQLRKLEEEFEKL